MGNIDRLGLKKRKGLYAAGAEIKDVPTGSSDAADIQILIELSKVTITNAFDSFFSLCT